MSLLTRQLLDEVRAAEQRSLNALLEAWDKELDAQAEALREAEKKRQAQAALEAVQVAAFESHIRGLVAQARGGADVSIPSGMRAASTLAIGPCDAELDALLATVDDAELAFADQARRSAAWALRQGLLPHPSDLASTMETRDPPWAAAFRELGHKLDSLDAVKHAHPRLQAVSGGERVDVLRREVQLLKAYSPERTLTLIAQPEKLGAPLSLAPPPPAERGPRMGAQALGKLLNNLF
jgi:hypothetical protein